VVNQERIGGGSWSKTENVEAGTGKGAAACISRGEGRFPWLIDSLEAAPVTKFRFKNNRAGKKPTEGAGGREIGGGKFGGSLGLKKGSRKL